MPTSSTPPVLASTTGSVTRRRCSGCTTERVDACVLTARLARTGAESDCDSPAPSAASNSRSISDESYRSGCAPVAPKLRGRSMDPVMMISPVLFSACCMSLWFGTVGMTIELVRMSSL